MRIDFAGLCFTDAQGIVFHHDLNLVVLSYLIAVGGSYAALEIIERWRSAQGTRVHSWQLAGATALGGSIWSMHFTAMLALRINLPLRFAPGPTLLSLLLAIGAVGCGLQIIRARTSWPRVGCAGVTVGLGVAAMHYVGMAGLRFPGTLAYTPTLWSLSLLVGIAAATVALWLSLTLKGQGQRGTAALVMGGAICGMHYTGMAATVLQVDLLVPAEAGLPSGPLAAAVAVTTLALIICALTFVMTDRWRLASALTEAAALRQANAELELGRLQFNAVLDNMTQGVCFFDGETRLIVSNRRYAEIYDLPLEATRAGISLAEIVDHRLAAGSTPDMSRADYLEWRAEVAAAKQPSNTVVTLKNARVVAICHQSMPDGGWVATHDDITERKQAEASLVFMSRHDALTRLPNRVLFYERLEQALGLAGRGTGCAVLCLDLDHFKLVNDTLGHPAGDDLLRAAAERLQDCVRGVDTVARLGGDEFAIIQLATNQPGGVELLANRIVAAFRNPFEIDGHQIMVGTSVGVAMAPGDGTSAENLLKNADIALYLAKSEGRGTVRFFEPEMDARIQLRRTLELDLRGAIARSEFELYYQPLVNLEFGKVTGFEALLRWHHPVRGLVSPAEFIPLAEETGMIVPIGEWVLRTACFEAENWPGDINVAVNLSPVQFKKGDIVASVMAALDASGLRPDRLELEITESVLLQDTADTLAALRQLRACGVAVALDDFGTGYSSLSYLRSFPFDKIKIDQSFVRDLVQNKESMLIIRAVTGLGHSLCMRTTAEGVETLEQLNKLREEGCTEVQGYIFSPPRPASELPSLIESLQQIREDVT
jgi:diguanylate cyclase (GGDEF)-like protein